MRLRVNATRNRFGSVVYFVERRRRFLGIPYWSEVRDLYTRCDTAAQAEEKVALLRQPLPAPREI